MANESLKLMAGQTLMQQIIDLMVYRGESVKVENKSDNIKKWKCLVINKLDGTEKVLTFNWTGTEMLY